jgi:5-methylcytosine-specific restriction endonuclease McrA
MAVLNGREVDIMAYVLTNGNYYIRITENGGVAKTKDVNEAQIYLTMEKAKERLEKAQSKTKGYYILDIVTNEKYKLNRSRRRIRFPEEARKLIYNTANGRCILCGRKITYDNMTLDHIVPLVMNGADDISNLQCTCKACNEFKGSILPDDFMERITEIFIYQTDIKQGNRLLWKITHRLLNRLI